MEKKPSVDELAQFYFQDKLAKFCPGDKTERPNGFEVEMFRYGLEHSQKEIARLREALEYYTKLPEILSSKPLSAGFFWSSNVAREALKGEE